MATRPNLPKTAPVTKRSRDEVGLTGAKEGCGTGDCGACSILVDDRVNCACSMFAPEADGTVIVTVEGLADSGELHPTTMFP